MHLCGGGYDTLDKISGAELAVMEKAMEAYYKTLGKRLSDFQAVIPLDWMIGGATDSSQGRRSIDDNFDKTCHLC